MKSIHHGTAAANSNLKGKKTLLLSCKCCVLFNPKWEERVKAADKEIKSLYDGADLVSTGRESGEGSTKGDGRNPSKICKRQ